MKKINTKDNKRLEDKPKKKALGVVAIRHAQVLANVRKNVLSGGRVNKKKAMMDAGYSKNYAECGNINTTKGWNSLLEKNLPDDMITEAHKELIFQNKIAYMLFNPDITYEDIYEIMESAGSIPKKIVHGLQGTHVFFFQSDGSVRAKAIEMAYKVKGRMAAEKIDISDNRYKDMSAQEIVDRKSDLIKKYKKLD